MFEHHPNPNNSRTKPPKNLLFSYKYKKPQIFTNGNIVVFQSFKTSDKKRLKKVWCKVLFNGKDSLLLHPQQRQSSLDDGKQREKGLKIYFQIFFEKACEK